MKSPIRVIVSFLVVAILVSNVLLITLSPTDMVTSDAVSSPQALMAQTEQVDPPVDTISAVWDMLLEAGVTSAELEAHKNQLPSMRTIAEQYGTEPVIVGLESCDRFRRTVPPERRMLGAAGMFSTGTNLVTQLLKHNCFIPARQDKYGPDATKEELGMRWQVPWGKHTPAHFKWKHATEKASAINKSDVLPVVTIRNPWLWMQSMCKNPYAARWPHHSMCPHLKKDNNQQKQWNEVSVKYGAATESYLSLAHLWNDWYRDYLQARIPPNQETNNNSTKKYPWVAVRIEDLVFQTVPTIRAVCTCAGGRLRKNFRYITDSAKKDSPGHDTRTGILRAWIKYSQPLQPGAGFGEEDYHAALEALDDELVRLFQYHHPPAFG